MSDVQLGIKITADGSKAVASLNQVSASAQTAGRSISSGFSTSKRSTDDFNSSLMQSKALMAGLSVASAYAMKAFAESMVRAGSEIDRMNGMLEAASGSSQKAAANFQFVQKTAYDMGVNLASAADGFTQITAAAQGTALQGQATRDIFTAIVRAAAALGKSSADTNGMLLAISQMMSKGKVSAEELRQQLGERLPGAFGLAAQAMGVTTAQLDDMLQKGQVTAEEMLPRFAKVLDDTYSSARFTRISNEVERLDQTWENFKRTVIDTEGMAKAIRGLTGILKGFVDDLQGAFGLGENGLQASLEKRIAEQKRVIAEMKKAGPLGRLFIDDTEIQQRETELRQMQDRLDKIKKSAEQATREANQAATTSAVGGRASTPLGIAQQFQGMTERGNAEELTKFLNAHSGTVFNNLTVPWCARFVNAALDKAGIKGTGSAGARSFESFGKGIWQRGMSRDALADVQPGDIAVFTRKGGGHVGFVKAIDPSKGLLEILGGNQSNAVSVAKRSMQDLIAIRRPPTPGAKSEYEDFDKYTKRAQKEQEDAKREAEKRLRDSTQRYIANLDDQAKTAQRQAEIAISGIDNQIAALDRERDAWDKSQQDKLDAAKGSYDAMAQLEAERAAKLQDYAARELALIQQQYDARKRAMEAAAGAYQRQLSNPNLTDDEERRAKQGLADIQADLVKLANDRAQAEAKAGQAALEANRGGLELAQKQREFIAGINAELTYQTQLYSALKAAKEQGATPQQLDVMSAVSGQMRDAGQSVSAQELLALEPLLTKLEEIKQKKQEILGVDQQVREEQLRMNQAWQEATDQARLFAQQATEAFGQFGDSIGQIVVGIAQFGQQSMQVQRDMRDEMDRLRKTGKSTPEKEAAIQMKAATKSAQYQISLYGDISQAAAGFFDEGSKGYASLSLASKAFRAFEMAMAVQSAVQQIAANAQVLFSDTARTTVETTNSAIRGQAKAAEAVANQGSGGDPYSAFPRMAAMAAIMAALGFGVLGAVAGGSSKTASAEERQRKAGTGTVLGDSTAQSDSIAGSLDMLRENSNTDLSYSAAMVASLRNIEQGIAGLTNSIIAGVSPQVNPGQLGSSKLFAGSLFSSVKKEISDYGIKDIPQTIAQIIKEGFAGQVYTDIKRTTKIFGMTIGESVKTQMSELDGTVAAAFTSTIKSVVANIGVVGSELGINADSFNRKLNGFVVDLGNISLKGLSGQEITDTLNATFGKLSDELMAAAIPGLGKFRQAGEGYAKTAIRVADGLNRATLELERLGITAINYKEIANKQGDVAAEIIRQSIATAEAGSSIGKFIEVADGAAEDLIDAYRQLTKARTIFMAAGIDTSGITQAMTNAAGGVSEFLSSMEDFRDSFLTDNEKLIGGWQDMAAEFTKLGLKIPATNEEFKALVKGIDTSTEAGQKLFGQVISLSGAFSDLTDAMDDAKSALQSAYDTAKQQSQDLRDYLDSLKTGQETGGSVQSRYEAAKAQYEKTLAAANQGDAEAVAKLREVSTIFLDLSKQYFGATAQYATDLQSVNVGMGGLADSIDRDISLAEKQQAWLKANTDALTSLKDALNAYEATMAKVNGIASSQTGKTVGEANADNNANDAAAKAQAERQRVADLYEDQINKLVREMYAARDNGNMKKAKELRDSIAWLEQDINSSAYNLMAEWLGKKFDVKLRAKGGFTPPGLTLVGEEGPELVRFIQPSHIHPAEETARLLKDAAAPTITPDAPSITVPEPAWNLPELNTHSMTVPEPELKMPDWQSMMQLPPIKARAAGGFTPPGLTLVGEQGPELVDFTRPGQVYTSAETKQALGMDTSRLEARLEAIEKALSTGIKIDQSGYITLRDELKTIRAELAAQTSVQKLAAVSG